MSNLMGDDRLMPSLIHADHLGVLTPLSETNQLHKGSHFVQFYDNDFFLLDSLTEYISNGLQAGDACIVIATESHRDRLAAKLMGHSLDVVNDGLGRHYFAFDAEETLSRFLVDDVIYPELFRKVAGDVLTRAGKGGRHVRAFGEMVALLAGRGNFKAATQLEQLWNELKEKHEFSLFCAYSLKTFNGQNSKALMDVCQEHSQLIPTENYNALTSAEDRLRAIVLLQQKANELESEIAERHKAEQALLAATDDLKRLLISEQLARAEAEMANSLKDEFLATVSHELRTPLNAIIGWTHMLRIGKLETEATDRAIETIDRNAKAQAQLVEDLLDVSRVISGKLQLNITPVDTASIINAAIDSVQPAATSKEIQIEVTLDPAIRRISGDASRLQQIVWNLLSNAIKFTPAKGRVNVSLKRKLSDVQITVSDTGRGIDPAFVPFIFDRFRQADSSTTRNCGGLGLGLSIVRHLVELHGGKVEAHSDGESRGATFTITLPNLVLQSGEPSAVSKIRSSRWSDQPQEKEILPASIAGQQILLVDDNDDSLNMLAEVLRERGAIVETAQSAREAIEVLDRFQADVIVSDLAMPEDDGYTLIQAIRARETGERKLAQAIALTALVRVEDRARALSAGFNMFLPKPIQPNELITAIGNLTSLS
jgi:signal transduction histidine kinase/ActR/RegA family two-component response regulator